VIDRSFTELFSSLCALPGISGQERRVAAAVRDELLRRGADVKADTMGNVCARIKGKGNAPSLMFIAHLDEVGAIVSEISENGLILFRTVGCVDQNSLPSARVRVAGCPGAVSAPPAHMAKGASAGRLYIDVGAESKAQVLEMGINIGSMITFDTPFVQLTENRVCGHALDDRVGCTMLIKLFEKIDFQPEGDVIFGFSVREETTMAGAGMLVDRQKPDWVVAIDTVPMRMSSSGAPVIDLGRGPVFQLAEGVMGSFVGSFVHEGVKDALISAAQEAKSPYQLCAEVGDWTTDGDTISRGNGGTPGGYLSIPRRSAHCASEVMDLRDPLNGIDILYTLVKNMNCVKLELI